MVLDVVLMFGDLGALGVRYIIPGTANMYNKPPPAHATAIVHLRLRGTRISSHVFVR